ncbi:MAG: nuclear transport factor 2 family protein [Novosphingobium sp.]|nr:nuclear transport factor 2 family protein [Novosphingobium sp.]
MDEPRKRRSKTDSLAKSRLAAIALAAVPAAGAAQAPPDKPLYVGRLDPFREKTLEQRIQELTDREEIRDLIATYAHRVAHGLSIADLFTDDGVYINRHNGAVSEARGRAALEARFHDRPGDDGSAMPMIHNILISIDGDQATDICSNELRITENGKSIIASGYYDDQLRREHGRWKFVKRDITFFHWVPLQEGWAKPAGK